MQFQDFYTIMYLTVYFSDLLIVTTVILIEPLEGSINELYDYLYEDELAVLDTDKDR